MKEHAPGPIRTEAAPLTVSAHWQVGVRTTAWARLWHTIIRDLRPAGAPDGTPQNEEAQHA